MKNQTTQTVLSALPKRRAKSNKTKGNSSAHKKLLKDIDSRANGCCLCLTFRELLKIKESEFVSLMRNQYKHICGKKLSSSRISSWKDEYKQFKEIFIPVFRKEDPEILDFHVVFELKLPLDVKDLESNLFVFSDAVIVGDDCVAVLEFKRLDSTTIDFDYKQAKKYMHRLRYHKAARLQSEKYVYVVYTKEIGDTLYSYEDKDNFWFGSPRAVANDLCYQLFNGNVPCFDIGEWLDAGFKQKKQRK